MVKPGELFWFFVMDIFVWGLGFRFGVFGHFFLGESENGESLVTLFKMGGAYFTWQWHS